MNCQIIFTDRYKITEKRELILNVINGLTPKFICWDGKLWKHTGMGISAYFYHEVENFQLVN